MSEAFICDAIRTPIGRYAGALATVRTDDLAAIPLKALRDRNPGVDWEQVDDVILGCANQAGEDNRNVARMASLLAGLPAAVPGCTVNRLCGSGMEAVGSAARAIKTGEAELIIAGGVESMSRAPFVMGKAESAFSRGAEIFDSTIGWRFVNPLLKAQYGIDAIPETAENVAEEYKISREDQASEAAAHRHELTPRARVLAMASAGVRPRIMGMGPVPATRRVLGRAGLALNKMDLIELNEAFAAQALAVLRELGLADDAPQVNPQGGAIALGHPLGMSGARLVGTACHQLARTGGRYALCTLCIGVGQGIALVLERV